jgi:hypothetical protein
MCGTILARVEGQGGAWTARTTRPDSSISFGCWWCMDLTGQEPKNIDSLRFSSALPSQNCTAFSSLTRGWSDDFRRSVWSSLIFSVMHFSYLKENAECMAYVHGQTMPHVSWVFLGCVWMLENWHGIELEKEFQIRMERKCLPISILLFECVWNFLLKSDADD